MAVKNLVRRYIVSDQAMKDTKGKHIVSARISVTSNDKLESLAKTFGLKKSTFAAELLEAAIDEVWEETNDGLDS